MSEEVSILIIEDEAIVAHDIGRRVRKLGYDVAALKHSYQDAMNYLSIHSPDLVLCDIMLGAEQDGIDIAKYIATEKRIPFIFLTALSDRVTLDRAKTTLPYGYIVKPFTDRDLLTAIEMALYKHSVELEKLQLSPEKLSSLTSEKLSDREFSILLDITRGLTNAKIAEAKFISINTVKFHIGNILEKMNVKNRAEALHKIIEYLTAS